MEEELIIKFCSIVNTKQSINIIESEFAKDKGECEDDRETIWQDWGVP